MPKVSIVLPTYNGQDYLEKSLDSILHQTFQDWELIIVNDCSVDSTLEIAETYAKNDSRIRIVNNTINQKLPKSLNIGFEHALGEYFTWTSDDNVYIDSAIEKMVSYLDNYSDAYMVCAGMEYIDDCDNIIGNHRKYDNTTMLLNNILGACFMYRKQVVSTIGEYDTSLFLVEDYDYWLRILFHYGKIDFIDETLYLYRMHSKSLTDTRVKEVHEMLLKLRMKHIEKFIEKAENIKFVLCALYYDFRNNNCEVDYVQRKIRDLVPALDTDNDDLKADNKVVVYGAGNIGKAAYKKFGENIVYYVDRNEAIIGDRIEGIEIKSIDSLQELSKKYSIVIAAGLGNVYDFLCTLGSLGIKCNSVYTDFDDNRNDNI